MRLRLGLVLLTLLAALAVALTVPHRAEQGALSGDHRTPVGHPPSSAPDRHGQPRQTSDGEPGAIAPPYDPFLRTRPRITKDRQWKVAPGIRFRKWIQSDSRGRARLSLLRADPDVAGVSVEYGEMPIVPQRAPVPTLVARAHGLGGVNGGFFDIYDTGAPLGIGRDRQQGMLHGAKYTWHNAFYLTQGGDYRIGPRTLTAQIEQFPQIEITNVNSPRVREGAVGIYAPAWGRTFGYRITDGQKKRVRMVVIQDGRVASNRTTLNSDRQIDGLVLIGRGPGAEALAQLKVGSIANVQWGLPGEPQMAISGESILLRKGVRRVTDDRELHPRTAIGIDRDTGRLLMLVVDGRQSFSRGLTLVEEATMMKQLGAEDALNFDGGGSSTMVAKDRNGDVRVLNSPSDGQQRSIPDGIAVLYSAP